MVNKHVARGRRPQSVAWGVPPLSCSPSILVLLPVFCMALCRACAPTAGLIAIPDLYLQHLCQLGAPLCDLPPVSGTPESHVGPGVGVPGHSKPELLRITKELIASCHSRHFELMHFYLLSNARAEKHSGTGASVCVLGMGGIPSLASRKV